MDDPGIQLTRIIMLRKLRMFIQSYFCQETSCKLHYTPLDHLPGAPRLQEEGDKEHECFQWRDVSADSDAKKTEEYKAEGSRTTIWMMQAWRKWFTTRVPSEEDDAGKDVENPHPGSSRKRRGREEEDEDDEHSRRILRCEDSHWQHVRLLDDEDVDDPEREKERWRTIKTAQSKKNLISHQRIYSGYDEEYKVDKVDDPLSGAEAKRRRKPPLTICFTQS